MGDIILQDGKHYRVKHLRTVEKGPDAGKRDVMDIEQVVMGWGWQVATPYYWLKELA